MAELIAPGVDAEFQYSSRAHQADTAIAGMWLFLASEVLFFGTLAFVWAVLRATHPDELARAVGHTNLLIGSVNTALLVSSSLMCAWAAEQADRGASRAAFLALLATCAIGVMFLGLKLLEWRLEFSENLFPGPGFSMDGGRTGGAQLFFAWYFVVTGLHAVHMLIGIGLLGWCAWRARRGDYRAGHATQVEVAALYWSFVDLVWVVLFVLIYVAARP